MLQIRPPPLYVKEAAGGLQLQDATFSLQAQWQLHCAARGLHPRTGVLMFNHYAMTWV